MKERIAELMNALPAQCDAAVVVTGTARRYLTGFASSDGILFLTRKTGVLLMDGRYEEAARASVRDVQVLGLTSQREQLPALCRQYGVRRVALETALTVRRAWELADLMPDVEVQPEAALDEALARLRMVKATEEIMLLRQAQQVTQAAFSHILGFIRTGVRERDIAAELEYAMRKNGAQAAAFETIAVSGPNSSLPHGVPGDRAVQLGDLVTMDFGAVVDGYHADMTRTVAVGFAGERQAKVYETVLTAQEAALAALGPGVACAAADAAARDVIARAGYGDCFVHSTGHGVGLEIHEGPNLSQRSEQTLAPGNVVTVEPGIYLPGAFGVRIEDMALITAHGYENLTSAPKNLIVLDPR